MWLRFVKPLKWLEAWFRPYKKMLEGVLFDMRSKATERGGRRSSETTRERERGRERERDAQPPSPVSSPLSSAKRERRNKCKMKGEKKKSFEKNDGPWPLSHAID
ncbi:unnamed protein product [Camellia sinensis]